MRELDVPLYVQIARVVRQQISTGTLPPGARLPSEVTLMREHGVARETVRHALAILRAEGLITVDRGKGTIVRETPEKETVPLYWGDTMIGRMPTPQEKARLGLDDGVGVMVIHRKAGGTEVYAGDRTTIVAQAA